MRFQLHEGWAGFSWWQPMALWLLLGGLLSVQDPTEVKKPVPRDQERPKVEVPTTRIKRDGCVTTDCHPGVKSSPFLHGPVNVNGCDACHELVNVEKHKYKLLREKADLCSHCHDPNLMKGKGQRAAI